MTSEAWAQGSGEPSKVSDCAVCGSRTEKEPHANTKRLTQIKELQHLHKGASPFPDGLGARLT